MLRGATTCCGCCNLKAGTIITGVFGLLFPILGIIIHTVVLDHIEEEDTQDHLKIIIIYSYLYTAVDVILIYGAFKEYKYFLLPWIAYVGFGLGLASFFCLIFMFFVPGLTAGTVIAGALWYVWYCVISYYNELNIPTSTIIAVGTYPGIAQTSYMASSVITYEPQPPAYAELGKGPIVV